MPGVPRILAAQASGARPAAHAPGGTRADTCETSDDPDRRRRTGAGPDHARVGPAGAGARARGAGHAVRAGRDPARRGRAARRGGPVRLGRCPRDGGDGSGDLPAARHRNPVRLSDVRHLDRAAGRRDGGLRGAARCVPGPSGPGDLRDHRHGARPFGAGRRGSARHRPDHAHPDHPKPEPTHRVEVDRRTLRPGATTTLTYTVHRDSDAGDGSARFGLIGEEGSGCPWPPTTPGA